MDKDIIIPDFFICRMPENAEYKFTPNEWERCWDMTIKMKTKPKGVACAICGTPIGECGSDIQDCYYCEEDKIFMHLSCLITQHRFNRNPSLCSLLNRTTIGNHEDKRVKVKFVTEEEEEGEKIVENEI